jgi:hypothetical protein
VYLNAELFLNGFASGQPGCWHFWLGSDVVSLLEVSLGCVAAMDDRAVPGLLDMVVSYLCLAERVHPE